MNTMRILAEHAPRLLESVRCDDGVARQGLEVLSEMLMALGFASAMECKKGTAALTMWSEADAEKMEDGLKQWLACERLELMPGPQRPAGLTLTVVRAGKAVSLAYRQAK